MGYPQFESEFAMLQRLQLQHPIETLESVATAEEVVECQRQVRQVHVDEKVGRYIVQIIHATRAHRGVVAMMEEIRMGDVRDFRNFVGAVIDRKSFDKISDYLDDARRNATIVAGGKVEGKHGFFIQPTLVETDEPAYRLLCEEIFGPVVTAYVYDDSKWSDTLRVIDTTSPYALTGAVFANDRSAVREAMLSLRNAAGNFYINDKPTGAVVGQQPFGGSRSSGTNDKAGSKMNLMRYPFMTEE